MRFGCSDSPLGRARDWTRQISVFDPPAIVTGLGYNAQTGPHPSGLIYKLGKQGLSSLGIMTSMMF